MTTIEEGFSKKIARFDDELSDLKVSLGKTNTTLESQERILNHYGKVLDRISEKLSNKEFDWKTFISGVALIIAIGSAVLLPIKSDIEKSQYHISAIKDRTSVNGWSKSDQHRFEDKLIQRLDKQSKLEREILDLKEELINSKLLDIEHKIENLPITYESYQEKWKSHERQLNNK